MGTSIETSERALAGARQDWISAEHPGCADRLAQGSAVLAFHDRMEALIPTITRLGARVAPIGLRRTRMGTELEARVGKPISAQRIVAFPSPRTAAQYIRRRSLALTEQPWPELRLAWKRQEPIAPGTDGSLLRAEMDSLADKKLLTAGEFDVVLFHGREAPQTLNEIGRLREMAFRAEGEGTGRAYDLDAFDSYYEHLTLWNREKHEIVGAYRIGRVDEILARRGPGGLYSSTLFRFDPKWWSVAAPALELGRSFIRAEYRKNYQPLLLLWKGIGQYLVRNPQYRYLFGPVSVSARFSIQTREVIHAFFQAQRPAELPRVQARHPFRPRPLAGRDMDALGAAIQDLDELGDVVSDLERRLAALPVLLRQYSSLGGVFVQFNVDPQFSNVLDGLVLVDLHKTERRLLDRYLGKGGAEKYLSQR